MELNFILPSVSITGGIRVVFEYANRLSNRGHDVTILYPTIPPRMVENWTAPRTRVSQGWGTVQRIMDDGTIGWFDIDVPVQQIPTLSPRLIRYLEGSIPDADITIATSWETAYTVAKLSRSKGEKVYLIQHYEIWETWNSDDAWERVASLCDDPKFYPIEMYEVTPSSDKAQREKALVDRSYGLSLSKITISSWLSELIQTKFEEDIVDTIPNSVNHSTFYPTSNVNSGLLSILIPYRNKPWKGQLETRELISELQSTDIQIHTYGSGSRSDLPQYVNHHPSISDDELRQLYSESDIFVLTSWVEGFGLPPLEAMACECAVVSTDVGSVSDYAEDDETALIVPPRNSQALIDAVYELMENPEKRHRLQKQGLNRVNEYTWDEATIRLEATLRALVK